LSNAIQKAKRITRSIPGNEPDNDASNLLKEIISLKQDDPLWFIDSFTVNNNLTRIMWMTPKQIDLWLLYSDVIICDTTFGTNKYNMSLMLFIGVDNRNRSRLISQALIRDERQESFSWVLEGLKKATNNTTPRVIFSDADFAMHNAIKEKFPETYLMSCIFHIKQNIKKHLRSKLGDQFQEFLIAFDNLRNTLNTQQFQVKWEDLLNKYGSARQYLTDNLYPMHTTWAKCYINHVFNAGIQTTQRVEGTNAVIKRVMDNHNTLCGLFHDIEKRIKMETFKDDYSNWHDLQFPSNNIIPTMNRFFPNVDKILSKYLHPELFIIQRQQIQDSFMYDANRLLDFQVPYY
jgi:hypothetical protein